MFGISSGGIGNSQAANYNETDSRNNESNTQGEGNISYALGDSATLSDYGAISQAFQFAGAVDAGQTYLVDKMLKSSNDSIAAVKDSYQDAIHSVVDSKVADSRYLVIAGLVVVALFGLSMWGKR